MSQNGREQKAIEGLAASLQECLNIAARKSDERLDRQDETLRLIWQQVGGDRTMRLPVDD